MLFCPVCDVGTLECLGTEQSLDLPKTRVQVGSYDKVRLKRCQYCLAEILTVEKMDRMVSPHKRGV